MPSISLQLWQSERSGALQEIQAAHASIGGTGRGRRYATQQINCAYVMLLSGQFQGYCRDLHTECVDYLAGAVPSLILQDLLRSGLLRDRRIDRGNAFPGNIGDDFSRFGLTFLGVVNKHSPRNAQRQAQLEALNSWRNAIAHQSFDPAKLGGKTTVQLAQVRQWHAVCNNLAQAFDHVMGTYIAAVVGSAPW